MKRDSFEMQHEPDSELSEMPNNLSTDDNLSSDAQCNVCHSVDDAAVRASDETDFSEGSTEICSSSPPSKRRKEEKTLNAEDNSVETREVSSTVCVRKGKSLTGSKKGIVKRSCKPLQVSQSCQAVSEEIREATKKAKELSTGDTSTTNGSCSVTSNSLASGVLVTNSKFGQQVRVCSSSSTFAESLSDQEFAASTSNAPKYKPNMHDKATSTSDPVMEEDHDQVRSDILIPSSSAL